MPTTYAQYITRHLTRQVNYSCIVSFICTSHQFAVAFTTRMHAWHQLHVHDRWHQLHVHDGIA